MICGRPARRQHNLRFAPALRIIVWNCMDRSKPPRSYGNIVLNYRGLEHNPARCQRRTGCGGRPGR
ncbi:hypothetical protein CBM2623_U90005 [Cupriavidus taiwanensis]|nr:hypothetical protein CBM2623_U90005 [Cupriavidus taiwanensis]